MQGPKLTTSLWFNGVAEEAAAFYVSVFPNSQIEEVIAAPVDNPSTAEGEVVAVAFTLAGRPFIGINGGPGFPFTEAVSVEIACRDQAEVDHYWAALTDGGSESQCGWLKDRYGLSWQVVPARLYEMLRAPDRNAARRAFKVMLTMTKLDLAALEAAFAGS